MKNLKKTLVWGLLFVFWQPTVLLAGICTVESAGTQIEAENYTSATSGTYFIDQTSYLEATNKELNFPVPPEENPVGYDLYFAESGSYYIYVYGNSNGSSSENSIWYGVDDQPVGGIELPTVTNDNWSNTRFREGPTPPVINITTAGVHTINFWSREPGFKFIAFSLRKDSSSLPATVTVIDPTDPGDVCITPDDAVAVDFDGDGYTEDVDCNDFDDSIYPGATEICGNSIKENCDNTSADEGCTTVVVTDSGDLAQVPLILANPAKPRLLLNMSKDHQMFLPAFKEYDDLDNDLRPDKTYIHSVEYYGYFDSDKCYDYDSTDARFEPASVTTDRYCSGNWSGNFLNWASMSRMDVVRKILYGGYRSTDTDTLTVLERSYIPNDMHSWVKFYNGSDIDQLTPYTSVEDTAPTSASSSVITIGTGSKVFSHSFTDVQVGDQVTIEAAGYEDYRYMEGVVTAETATEITVAVTNAVGSGNTHNLWTITDWSRQGISICNTTYATSGFSQDITAAPLMRIASGDYGLWTANEGVQCRWNEENNLSNANVRSLSGLNANSRTPVRSDVGMGNVQSGQQNDYAVRVEACNSSLMGSERCREYPDGNYKPVGLLQIYGENDSLYFGLMTGSYSKNKSGGVLRKNIGSILDEIDTDNGTFLTAPADGAIIKSLDLLRIFGYSHTNRNYSDTSSSGDNCNYDFSRPPTGAWADGQCTNWGNPQSEIFLESLRYFAGASASSAFSFSGDDKISGLGTAAWSDPLSADTYCSSLNIINFNASIPSFDNDQLSGVSDLNTTDSASTLTDIVGEGEGIHDNEWFVGENGSVTSADVEYQICTSKEVTSLGDVEGTCPEAPKSDGSFQIAGLAHYAFTNDIRDDLEDDQNVKIFGVEMAAAVPKIVVPMPYDGTKVVTILPACRDHRMTPAGSCSIVNFKVINQNIPAGHGEFYVQWEASASGGDHDQDLGGILKYEVDSDASTITVTTDVIALSAGMISPFGYTISGTTADGFHAHTGVNGYVFEDSSGVTDCSSGCNDDDAPGGEAETSATYSVTGESGGLLKSPLYYASKWGGYHKEVDGLTFPDDDVSWDADGDGLPDNYFYATNPRQLEANLKDVLENLAEVNSSSAAVASNSTQLRTGTTIYQAKFNSTDWSGEFLGIGLSKDANGDVVATELWNAEDEFPAHASRNIYTYNPSATTAPYGAVFSWSSLTGGQQLLLNTNIGSVNDGLGEDRVNYFRGDRSTERQNGGDLRDRNKILGDIVNSDPVFVGTPNYGYHKLTTEGAAYTTFRSSPEYTGREHVVYVGANNGMLHSFNAETGVEEFAYVPNAVIEHMPRLTATNYGTQQNGHRYMVDGAPKTGDAYFGGAWHSVLLGATGAGGKAVFALDISTPGSFDANDVLWEITPATTDASNNLVYTDLGNTIPQPTIGRLASGEWVAFISNGYHSTNGKAILYVVDIATGLPLATANGDSIDGTIDVEVGDTTTPNGLSTPVPVDNDGDKIVDFVYAGDLQGNLWKFNFTGNENGWGVAYSQGGVPKPLIKVQGPNGEVQPITVRPAIGRHSNGTDIMVWFGTGKFFDSNDNVIDPVVNNRPVQSFYGVHDAGTSISYTTRSDVLQSQSILFEGKVPVPGAVPTEYYFDGQAIRVTSQNTVDYSSLSGWYMDLVSPNTPDRQGERVVEQPVLNEGKIIFVTLIPSDSPCEPGGTSWLMELDPFEGGRLTTTVFDKDGDGDIDDDDKVTIQDENGNDIIVPVGGIESREGIIQAPKILDDASDVNDDGTGNQQKVFSGSTGNLMFQKEKGGDLTQKGRQSWRQIK